jgi:hypothetical protein
MYRYILRYWSKFVITMGIIGERYFHIELGILFQVKPSHLQCM